MVDILPIGGSFMVYQSRIFHLFKPATTFYQLQKAETIYSLKWRILLLFFLSTVIFAVQGYYGIGSSSISTTLTLDPKNIYEWHKALFIIGKLLSGIAYASCILFVPALLFNMMTEVSFYKLVVLQVFVLFILLIEQITYIPLLLLLHLDWYSSPLSFGIIGQYITKIPFLIALFGCISIFKIWGMYIQFTGLRVLSEMKRLPLFAIVFIINLLFWGISALLTYMDFYRLL